MSRNRAENVARWRIDELTAILLRQFKRLLAQRDVELTEVEIQALAHAASKRMPLPVFQQEICAVLRALIRESRATLAQWNLTFERSLKTSMEDLPGWETTADFLEIANEKGNAELRISAGSALLALLGDYSGVGALLATYQHGAEDPEDVDAVIARRALLFASRVPEDTVDWISLVQQWAGSLYEPPYDDA